MRKHGVVAAMPACEHNTMCAPKSQPVVMKSDEQALAQSRVPFSNSAEQRSESAVKRNPHPSQLHPYDVSKTGVTRASCDCGVFHYI